MAGLSKSTRTLTLRYIHSNPFASFLDQVDEKFDANNDDLGSGDGMSEKSFHPSTRDWSCSPEICIIPPRPDVSIPSLYVTKLTLCSPEIFDEYTRRQYVAKAPERNPFGTEEEPAKFTEFDIFTKVGDNAWRGMVVSAHPLILDSSITTAHTVDHGQS